MAVSEDVHNIWTERFRPKSVKQIILPSKVKKKINKIISSGVLPNLLIYDPKPGNGKSSLSRSICNDMEIEDVLYANGSGEANIDFLRTDITAFASTFSTDGKIKVVIIDDLGSRTADFQASLKVFSEKYSSVCRFIISTNSLNHVIEPIKSRFELIEFNFDDPLVKVEMIGNIKKGLGGLLKKLDIKYSEVALDQLISLNYPDMRWCIKSLQVEYLENGEITEQVIRNTTVNKDFYDMVLNRKFSDARKYLIEKQIPYQEMYGRLFREFLPLVENKSTQAQMILKIHDYADDSTRSLDQELCFIALLVEIIAMLGVKKND
jgi:replication factor C small subunit